MPTNCCRLPGRDRLGRLKFSIALAANEHGVIAPRRVRHILQGESPNRARSSNMIKRLIFQFSLMFLASIFSNFAIADNQATPRSFPNTSVWLSHYNEDILPYWIMDDALGTPIGNFPTFRNMSGHIGNDSDRYVRALARQVYVYLLGFNLTGDDRLLAYGQKGLDWISNHAVDKGKGFFTILDEDGKPISTTKSAQDIAYIASAYSADYFVTRNPKSKEKLDEIVTLIFEGPYWNNENGILRDALDNDLKNEVPFENHGTDLVTLLDQVNAYLLLYTNQVSHINSRRKLLYRLRHLGDLLVERFLQDKIFWNTDLNRVNYKAKHVDTGHTFKTYWMLHRIDRIWNDEFKYSLYTKILSNVEQMLIDAYGIDDNSFWGMRFSPIFGVTKSNPDWWIQIEIDQLTADLSIDDKSFVELLNKKSTVWLNSNFIDRGRAVRGIREGIKWDNSLYGNEDGWEAKANQWKNGYHETEHCVVLNIASHAVNDVSLTLYFALMNIQQAEGVRPYIFLGDIQNVKELGRIDGTKLIKAAVTFENIR